jgi:hypothetical protein
MNVVQTDGRDIDRDVAVLSGEASGQIAAPHAQLPGLPEAFHHASPATYYGQPLLKQSVWGVDIPLYYFSGGAAGAAMVLGAALQLCQRCAGEDSDQRRLSATCHWIGIAGSTIGAVFLIHDLGRPSRFLHMMRVFRPTSPMSMGAWILAGAAPTSIATGLLINRAGWQGRIGELSGYMAGIFGSGLSCYTGVLVSNSVIPVWIAARRWMPVLFAASAASATASILELFYEGAGGSRITQVFGTVGRTVELAAAWRVQQSADGLPRVGSPFRRGGGAVLWKAASYLTVAGLLFSLAAGRSRRAKRVAGICGIAGSLAMRFAVHYITNASARDARAAFNQQRAGIQSNSENQEEILLL